MKVRNVKVNSLASVFTDSTLSTFTSNAINKGVTDDSIIYIVCGANDTTYGSLYTEGSHWIWAKGEMFACDTAPEIDISGKEDKSNKVTSLSGSSTTTQYPSAKTVYDEFATTVTTQSVETVSDVTLEMSVNIPILDKSSDTSTNTFAIDPNRMYYFGTRTVLTITFNTPTNNNIINEYMFLFTSGNTATTLNVPSSVKWMKDPDISTNKNYGVSIQDNLGIIGEWDNE